VSSTTPRVGFYMPADDGSEPVDVATDLNDNLEKLDSALGFVPSTSGSPPTGLYDGKGTYETDTGRAKFRKGSVWTYLLTAGASFASDVWLAVGQKIGLGTTTPTAAIEIAVTDIVTDNSALKFRQSSDANSRMKIDVDGIRMGPGTSGTDVAIYRPTSNQIAITGSVSMANNLAVTGDVSGASVSISGDLDVGGQIVSDAFVTGKLSGTGFNVPNVIRKPSDTLRSSTTTTTDDPHLTFSAEANSAYFIQLFLFISSTTTADFKCAWTVPSGAAGLRWVLGEAVGGTDYATTTMRTSTHQPGTDVPLGGHSTSLFNGVQETAVFTTGATAGPITFKWAQNTSDANQTGVRLGSLLIYRKVE
jgi:hypothetical protein